MGETNHPREHGGPIVTTARDIMTKDPIIVDRDKTARDVAHLLATNGIGAVVVCGSDDEMQGMVTDRDLAVEVLGRDRDPDTRIGDILDGREVVTIGADDSLEEAIDTMKNHAVRRLPVIDGKKVIGMVSQADLARQADEATVGRLLEAISCADDNTAQG